ncbi:unnamed protein product [Phytophthora fragariaefolia]|uniref:Unnamed protein product n=1 Tax=Phytophthora fragariaefolia TaxID=1490495 RepID=A0A9W7D4G2_9STRA|nr:unnamed protein product [Phytophthora fragariaefolia]GMF67495.1 unnamed protein product [Phytophthora fragariaefolia]
MYQYIASMRVRDDVPLDNSIVWALYSNAAYAVKLPDSTASGFIDVCGGEFTKTISSDISAWEHDKNLPLVGYDLRSKAYNISIADSCITAICGNFYTFVDAYNNRLLYYSSPILHIIKYTTLVKEPLFMLFCNCRVLKLLEAESDGSVVWWPSRALEFSIQRCLWESWIFSVKLVNWEWHVGIRIPWIQTMSTSDTCIGLRQINILVVRFVAYQWDSHTESALKWLLFIPLKHRDSLRMHNVIDTPRTEDASTY